MSIECFSFKATSFHLRKHFMRNMSTRANVCHILMCNIQNVCKTKNIQLFSTRVCDGKAENKELGIDYDNKCIQGCDKYNYKPGLSSITADFDLACGTGPFLASFSTSAYWLAFLVACLTVGYFGDRWGRKVTRHFLLPSPRSV